MLYGRRDRRPYKQANACETFYNDENVKEENTYEKTLA